MDKFTLEALYMAYQVPLESRKELFIKRNNKTQASGNENINYIQKPQNICLGSVGTLSF